MSGHSIRQGDVHRRPGGDSASEVGQAASAAAESSVALGTSELNPIILAIWLAAQLGALALAAWRVPLAAQYPQPAELQAVCVLLAVQFFVSAMLCPLLLANWRMALVTLTSGAVILFIAGALAAWPATDPLYPTLYLAMWLADSFVWVIALKPKAAHFVAAIATAYVIGGPLLWCLGQDLGNPPPDFSQIAYGPLLPPLVHPHRPTSEGWWCLGSLFAAGLALAFLRRRRA